MLGNVTYEESRVPHWINTICEKIVKSLYDTQKPFKYMGNSYIVTCLIMQKTEAALQTSTACYYEGGTDSNNICSVVTVLMAQGEGQGPKLEDHVLRRNSVLCHFLNKMGFWFFLIYLISVVAFLFILVCVDPHSDSIPSKLHRLFFVHVPGMFKRQSTRVLGESTTSKVIYYATYIFKKPNPSFQIIYLLLSVGGFLIYVAQGFSHLPNLFLSEIHIYIGTGLWLIALMFFLMSCTLGPGFATKANLKEATKKFPYDNFLYKQSECRTCKFEKPARSKHCSVCDVCVLKQDHHCIWINQCVGYYNYKYFLAFLLAHAIVCLYGFQVGVLCLLSISFEEQLWGAIFTNRVGIKIQGDFYVVSQYLIQKYTAFFFVIVLCLVMGVVLLAFFAYHLYLVLKNTTSNERMKRLDFEAELAKIQNEAERHRFEEE